MHHVLQLDIQGTPQAWITAEEAALHYATNTVAWEDGESPLVTLRGAPRRNLHGVVPAVTKPKLLRRDRCTCAYCAQVFPEKDLEAEHIVPQSKGGPYSWTNLVSACRHCNARKRDRTPEQAGMPLVYLPYVPSRYEDFLLRGRNVRAHVHDWLSSRLPKASRLN